MFSEKLEGLLGLIYRRLPINTGKYYSGHIKGLLAQTWTDAVLNNGNPAKASEDTHKQLAKDFNPQGLLEGKRRITAVEIYMLCPQLHTIYPNSDIDRFINWFSKLQINSQSARCTEKTYRPPIEMQMGSVPHNQSPRIIKQEKGDCDLHVMSKGDGNIRDYH